MDERLIAVLGERAATARDGRLRLTRSLEALFDEDAEIRLGWDVWQQLLAYGSFSEALAPTVRRRQDTWLAHVAGLIRSGQQDASIAPRVDADLVATLLVVMLDGCGPSLRCGAVDLARCRALLHAALLMHLGPPPAAG